MDINQIVEQVAAVVKDAPEKLQEVLADPKGAIESITGQSLEGVDMAELVEKVKSAVEGAGIDVSGILGNIGEGIGNAVKDALGGLFNKSVFGLEHRRGERRGKQSFGRSAGRALVADPRFSSAWGFASDGIL